MRIHPSTPPQGGGYFRHIQLGVDPRADHPGGIMCSICLGKILGDLARRAGGRGSGEKGTWTNSGSPKQQKMDASYLHGGRVRNEF